eukprot:scaffold9116_cov63-Skeletonema_dohrnii-CCMP3373.AAC.1
MSSTINGAGGKAPSMEVITIDSSDDDEEQVVPAAAAASSSGQKRARKSPTSSKASAKNQNQEVIALLDDSSDDDNDDNPVPKMDRKRKARPCIEDEIIDIESSVEVRKPAARKRTASKNNSADNDDSPVIPFHLFETTTVKSPSALSQEKRKYFQTLREAIGLDVPNRQIQWLIISNFLIDFRYVYEKLPDIVQIPRVVVFYGSYFAGMDNIHFQQVQQLIMKNWKAAAERNGNTVEFIRLVPGDPPRSKTNPLPVKITYGCHHTK